MAGNLYLDTACVFPAPRSTHVCYDPAIDADKPDDEVLVFSVGPPFWYNIPSFDLLAVELRQMKVKGYTSEGEEKHYDMFIRNLPSFTRVYPVWMAIRDATIVDVRLPGLKLLLITLSKLYPYIRLVHNFPCTCTRMAFMGSHVLSYHIHPLGAAGKSSTRLA